MNEKSNTAAFVTAPLTSLSVREEAAFRLKISVVIGCLNFPGVVDKGVETALALGVEGVKTRLCAC